MADLKELALSYHSEGKPGKITVVSSKECRTQQDLALAYTPGVATPCLEIEKSPEKVWDYTSKGNLVAVVSDGTAVLGLGNIGAEAGIPVMEGKSVLFKRFADIDSVPLCISKVANEKGRTDAAKLIETVERLEPCFGGINLEDIGAPACFEVEKTLKAKMNIPVFHDDQHGTAIISFAAIINGLKIVGKKIEDCRFVVNGAGAAGISCSEFYITGGATKWLKEGLGIIASPAETDKIAQSVETNGGIYFVPAFTGLAAPHWDSYASGMMIGINGGTKKLPGRKKG